MGRLGERHLAVAATVLLFIGALPAAAQSDKPAVPPEIKAQAERVELLERAAAGDVTAKGLLAIELWNSPASSNDRQRAAELLREAADAGEPVSMRNLGSLLISGALGERDAERGVRLLEESAEAGDREAMRELSDRFHQGDGVEKDEARSRLWLHTLARTGDEEAILDAAERALTGRGGEVDAAAGLAWLQFGIDRELPGSMRAMAMVHESGVGVDKNPAQATAWYRKAAEAGDRTAMLRLSRRLANGEGAVQNAAEARRWLAEYTYGPAEDVRNDETSREAASRLASAGSESSMGWLVVHDESLGYTHIRIDGPAPEGRDARVGIAEERERFPHAMIVTNYGYYGTLNSAVSARSHAQRELLMSSLPALADQSEQHIVFIDVAVARDQPNGERSIQALYFDAYLSDVGPNTLGTDGARLERDFRARPIYPVGTVTAGGVVLYTFSNDVFPTDVPLDDRHRTISSRLSGLASTHTALRQEERAEAAQNRINAVYETAKTAEDTPQSREAAANLDFALTDTSMGWLVARDEELGYTHIRIDGPPPEGRDARVGIMEERMRFPDTIIVTNYGYYGQWNNATAGRSRDQRAFLMYALPKLAAESEREVVFVDVDVARDHPSGERKTQAHYFGAYIIDTKPNTFGEGGTHVEYDFHASPVYPFGTTIFDGNLVYTFSNKLFAQEIQPRDRHLTIGGNLLAVVNASNRMLGEDRRAENTPESPIDQIRIDQVRANQRKLQANQRELAEIDDELARLYREIAELEQNMIKVETNLAPAQD